MAEALPSKESTRTGLNRQPVYTSAMTSNIKPLAILASYMATAVALTIRCIAIARDRRSQKAVARPAVVALFATLAAVSLAATWSYMFAYFRWSYLDWAARSPAAAAAAEDEQQQLRLGEWLRETSLFRQAWFSALETPARAWWTLQIFGFCAIWSVMLSVQGAYPECYFLDGSPVRNIARAAAG